MIDIHTHILPGVDDGADSLTETVAMARAAVEEGIHTLIATPHHANGKYDNPVESVLLLVETVNQELQTNQIPLTVLPGQEIRVYSDLIEDLQRNTAATLCNSRYLLLEFPSNEIPRQTEELIYELSLLNIVPIIAHPERNMEISKDPSRLQNLIRHGALAQITSHSINGLFGKKLQKLSLDMCKQHLIHVVSSDAHNRTQRGFGLRQAYFLIGNYCGEERVRFYQNNAVKVISDEEIHPHQPEWFERKWWKFW